MKILSIVSTAFRATLEENDDAALWLSLAVAKEGAELSLLFRGNAVIYTMQRRNPTVVEVPELALKTTWLPQTQIQTALGLGVACYSVREDMLARGIDPNSVSAGIVCIDEADVADLLQEHDSLWHW